MGDHGELVALATVQRAELAGAVGGDALCDLCVIRAVGRGRVVLHAGLLLPVQPGGAGPTQQVHPQTLWGAGAWGHRGGVTWGGGGVTLSGGLQ